MVARSPNQVRLIAGGWRGRKLDFPPVPGLRPTPDRVRETLFNWLARDVPGARCLDLFAGSGALGLEARSRGATEVILVDRHPQVIAHLHQQIARLGMDRVHCHRAEALDWLRRVGSPCDVVFVDPPFADEAWDAVLAALARTGAVRSGGKVYVEAPQGRSLDVPSGWTLWREGRAGEIVFRVFITSPSTDAAVPGNAAGEISDARLR